MAIIGPADLPAVLRVRSDPLKKYVLSHLGYPNVEVEVTEDQWEVVLRTVGDWIAGYFPREQRLAVFYTKPLTSIYPLPQDAYWIQEVSWDPLTTNIADIFGAESYLFNVGNVTGAQNLLTDYHLLQAYRKFSQKILGTEGHWEVINEVEGQGLGGGGPGSSGGQAGQDLSASQQLIRLYPTPKGVYPVVVLYCPIVTHFRSPQARKLASDMLLAETKCMVGHARRKIAGMPGPTGSAMATDGEALVTEGNEMREKLTEQAINMGEPLPIIFMNLLPFAVAMWSLFL